MRQGSLCRDRLPPLALAPAGDQRRAETLLRRANNYRRLKEFDKEAADRQALLALNPDEAALCNNLAWLYITGPERLRDANTALPLARKAVALAPGQWMFCNTLGVVYYRLGNYPQALEMLEQSSRESNGEAGAFDWFFLSNVSCAPRRCGPGQRLLRSRGQVGPGKARQNTGGVAGRARFLPCGGRRRAGQEEHAVNQRGDWQRPANGRQDYDKECTHMRLSGLDVLCVAFGVVCLGGGCPHLLHRAG